MARIEGNPDSPSGEEVVWMIQVAEITQPSALNLLSALHSIRSNEPRRRRRSSENGVRVIAQRCPLSHQVSLGLDEGCDKLGCRINLE